MREKIISVLKQSLSNQSGGRMDVANVIHASGVSTVCTRRIALAREFNIQCGKPTQKVGIGMGLTWELGRKVQEIVAKAFKDAGILHKEEMHMVYKLTPQTELSGSIDTTLHDRITGEIVINEIKSISAEQFEQLEGPSINYEWQVMSYLLLAEKNKKLGINSKKAYITYVSKGYNNMPIKIFEITRSKQFNLHIAGTTRQLKAYEKTGKLPNRICRNLLNPMAKICPVVAICFKGDK